MMQYNSNKSLYVGDLADSVTEPTLRDFFHGLNIISMRLIRFTPANSHPRAYAYVNFNSSEEAEKALKLTYMPINGKTCRIAWLNRNNAARRMGIGNIFLKNFRLDVDPRKLAQVFGVFGIISSCKVVTDHMGISKGYGFVQFKNEEDAKKAIKAVEDPIEFLRTHGYSPFKNEDEARRAIQAIVEGLAAPDKPLIVNKFIPRTQRMQESANTWTNLFVKNIEASVTEKDFGDLCERYGRVRSCKLVPAGDKKTTMGYANYETHESALSAKSSLHGTSLKGYILEAYQHKSKQVRMIEIGRHRRSLTNLFIKNLDERIDEDRLRLELSNDKFSPIKSLKIERDEKGTSKGFGYVDLTTPEGAAVAIQYLHKKLLYVDGQQTKPLYVGLHEPKDIRNLRLQQQLLRPAPPVQYYHQFIPYPTSPPVAMPPRYPPYPRPGPAPYPTSTAMPMPANTRPNRPPQPGRAPPTKTARAAGRPPFSDNQVSPLTIAHLQQHQPEQQRLLLGERLYPIIARSQPTLAGKITGMLLDSGWQIEELLNLLSNEDKLNASINEAVALLAKESRTHPAPAPIPTKPSARPSLPVWEEIRNYPAEQRNALLADHLFSHILTLTPQQPQATSLVTTILGSYPPEEIISLLHDKLKLKRVVDDFLKKLS